MINQSDALPSIFPEDPFLPKTDIRVEGPVNAEDFEGYDQTTMERLVEAITALPMDMATLRPSSGPTLTGNRNDFDNDADR